MSLTHAILGILRDQPMTGYDLKTQCFDRSIAHFWPADQAQIYRTLDRMAAEGWVASEVEVQEGRPNRKVYRLTDAGQAELARWLRVEQPVPAYREPFLIQLFFAGELPNETIAGLLARQRALHQERLAHYHAIPLPPLADLTAERDLTLQRLTLELGIALEQAQIDWLDRARKVVAALPEGGARRGAGEECQGTGPDSSLRSA
jgi:PadR family transcriptional regulator AphA